MKWISLVIGIVALGFAIWAIVAVYTAGPNDKTKSATTASSIQGANTAIAATNAAYAGVTPSTAASLPTIPGVDKLLTDAGGDE